MASEIKFDRLAEIKEIDDRLTALTDLASNRVRTIAGGVIVFGWSIIVGLPDKLPLIIDRNSLIPPIIFSLLSLLADLLQYGFSWLEYHRRRGRGKWQGFYTLAVLLFIIKGHIDGGRRILAGFDIRPIGFK